MPAVFIDPGLKIFQYSTHPDQVGINDYPANNQGFPVDVTFRNPASANLYILTTPKNTNGLTIYTHVRETDTAYSGPSTSYPRSYKGPILCVCDVDNNDPAWNPSSIVGMGMLVEMRVGVNSQSYGTSVGIGSIVDVRNQPSGTVNEYCNWFAWMNAGTTAAPLAAGGHWWFTDWGVHGQTTRPGLLNGVTLVTNNFYNGSPSESPATGMSLVSLNDIGPANNYKTGSTPYPWDIGYHVSGKTAGGTGDGYTNAIQVGGAAGAWWPFSAAHGGDQGQVGRGVIVKAKNAGISVARLGAFISEGTGEAGGLILGADTNDANRVSLYRPSAGNATLNGNLAVTGSITSIYGSGRKLLCSVIAPGTAVASSAALTSIFTGATLGGSLTIPANLLQVGSMLRFELLGTFGNTASTPTLYAQVTLGGVIIAQSNVVTPPATPLTNNVWLTDHALGLGALVQVIGTSGKILMADSINLAGLARLALNALGAANQAPSQVTINTTTSLALDIKFQWGTASPTNTFQLTGGAVYLDG
jgi:hypothetical protein